MPPDPLEKRLAEVEKKLDALVRAAGQNGNDNWIESVSGSAKDDPDFAEVLKLGKEIRDAEEPIQEQD